MIAHIHAITEGSLPSYPCWLFASENGAWVWTKAPLVPRYVLSRFSHWSLGGRPESPARVPTGKEGPAHPPPPPKPTDSFYHVFQPHLVGAIAIMLTPKSTPQRLTSDAAVEQARTALQQLHGDTSVIQICGGWNWQPLDNHPGLPKRA